jgi:hypothetical protein
MTIAMFVALAAAGLLAWVLAERCPEHRPIALLLSALLASDAAQWGLEVGVIAPCRATLGVLVPWTGWARVAVHLAEAMWLVWPAGVVAASGVVFAGLKAWPALRPALFGWAAFVVGIAVGYPSARSGNLARVLGAAVALSIIISLKHFAGWYRRGTPPVTSAHFSLAMILAINVTSLFATWRVGFLQHLDVAQTFYLVLLCAIILLQGRSLWTLQSTS